MLPVGERQTDSVEEAGEHSVEEAGEQWRPEGGKGQSPQEATNGLGCKDQQWAPQPGPMARLCYGCGFSCLSYLKWYWKIPSECLQKGRYDCNSTLLPVYAHPAPQGGLWELLALGWLLGEDQDAGGLAPSTAPARGCPPPPVQEVPRPLGLGRVSRSWDPSLTQPWRPQGNFLKNGNYENRSKEMEGGEGRIPIGKNSMPHRKVFIPLPVGLMAGLS